LRATPRIAVLIPCRNEAISIAEVVRGFRTALPPATVYVYDNASTDGTAAAAAEAGAEVRREPMPGKGNVVRRMFADIDADVYVMVDGDGTYDPEAAPAMVRRLVEDNLDMVVATRAADARDDAFRPGHRTGNRTLTRVVGWLFDPRFSDIFSGYRAFSRRYVKSYPALASGFEVETELTIHALELKMPVAEIPARYGTRREGSRSKLSTWRDGARIFAAIVFLFKEARPFKFFGAAAAALAALSLALAGPLFVTYLRTGLVPRYPTAVLVTGIMVLAFLTLACGIVLDTVSRGRREAKRLRYLALRPVCDAIGDAIGDAESAAPRPAAE
jgi:glycosyltransferase involved in cell wall biosynthesis